MKKFSKEQNKLETDEEQPKKEDTVKIISGDDKIPSEEKKEEIRKEKKLEKNKEILEEKEETETRKEKQKLIDSLRFKEASILKSILKILKKVFNLEKQKQKAKLALLLGFLNCASASTSLAEKAFAEETKNSVAIESVIKTSEIKSDYEIPDSMEIKDQSEMLEKEIGILKEIGYKPIVDNSVDTSFFTEDFNENESIYQTLKDELENEANQENKISLDFMDTPTKGLAYLNDSYFSGELNPAGENIKISPFSIRSRKISEERIIIEVYPRIKGEKAIYSKIITEQEALLTAKQIKTILEKQFDKQEEIQKILDSIPPVNEIPEDRLPTFSVLKEKILSDETKKILNNFETVEINVTPEGQAINLYTNKIEGLKTLTLSREKMSKINSPLNIDGKVKEIKFRKKIHIKPNENGHIELLEYQMFIDSCGNIVERYYIDSLNAAEKKDIKNNKFKKTYEATEILRITPPIKFKEAQGQKEKTENIDLTNTSPELKGLNDFVSARTEMPLALFEDSKDYRIYTNLDHKETLEKYGNKFALLKEGVEQADRLFGFKGRGNIYIINSDQKNGIFRKENPDSVYIFDETINNISESSLLNLAFHERMHSLSNQLQINNKDLESLFEEIKKQGVDTENFFSFKSIKDEENLLEKLTKTGLLDQESMSEFISKLPPESEFLEKEKKEIIAEIIIPEYLFFHINEQNFFREYFEGQGHSQANPEEFLASFLTGFNYNENTQNDDWENKIMSLPSVYRVQYLETLEKLKSILEKKENIPKDAPIFKEIEKKIEFLAK